MERDGRPSAVIVADATLSQDPELVGAATSATLVAVERGDLLGELRASRARLVAAADAERGRIQRDLHDGAEQRLIALRVKLGLARASESGDSGARLDEFGGDVDDALRELRDLVNGIYPNMLAEYARRRCAPSSRGRWAESGCRTIASDGTTPRSSARPTLVASRLRRTPPSTRASRPWLSSSSDARAPRAQFVVTDNGAGFDPSGVVAGAGLVNISDRLAAVGGAVVIDSGPGRGCRVEGRVPLAGP